MRIANKLIIGLVLFHMSIFAENITKAQIFAMVEAGTPEAEIVAKVEASGKTNFGLSEKEEAKLKSKGYVTLMGAMGTAVKVTAEEVARWQAQGVAEVRMIARLKMRGYAEADANVKALVALRDKKVSKNVCKHIAKEHVSAEPPKEEKKGILGVSLEKNLLVDLSAQLKGYFSQKTVTKEEVFFLAECFSETEVLAQMRASGMARLKLTAEEAAEYKAAFPKLVGEMEIEKRAQAALDAKVLISLLQSGASEAEVVAKLQSYGKVTLSHEEWRSVYQQKPSVHILQSLEAKVKAQGSQMPSWQKVTVEEVAQWSKEGVSEQDIIAQMEARGFVPMPDFSMSTLLSLHKKGASAAVVQYLAAKNFVFTNLVAEKSTLVEAEMSAYIAMMTEMEKKGQAGWEGCLTLAVLLYNSKKYEEAHVYVKKSLKMKATAVAQHWEGRILLGMNQSANALKCFHESLKAQADNSMSHQSCYYIGTIYKTQNKKEEASAYFKKCLEIEPGHKLAKEALLSLEVNVGVKVKLPFGGGDE